MVLVLVIAGACTDEGPAPSEVVVAPTEPMIELQQTELDAYATGDVNDAWIVGDGVAAPGGNLLVRATFCPRPSLRLADTGTALTSAVWYFDPGRDTDDTRDFLLRIPAEFDTGDWDVTLTCNDQQDVAFRIRHATIEIAGPPESTTPITEVDPALQPTLFCRPDTGCEQLQPFPYPIN